ncbi:phosphoethanolamine transferase [Campylobacter pinnipediorum subsp. caledonicus]|uniref:phosphoethanolamine transferase n=1 Tax=Campylobacter pinnipediorum TaxID=1965231 RepID=UPI000995A6E1|nr:phosphoethanolamine--lipid A transferase [Campylobacter pinnipediorum]AQW85282.1 phosphoethanolamine transferase [Campylobacter pinnipediorum subsp. caledonicus]OPA71210.1 phosphoethanolamine transferase [Campylobacter pinnipediorum subsp. caledonicus]
MKLTQNKLITLVSIFFVIFYNTTFLKNVVEVYKFSGIDLFYLFMAAFTLTSFLIVFFTLLSSRYTTKPILIITLFVSSFSAYFIDTYHIVIDTQMIQNIVQTNLNESFDLFSLKLLLYVVFLGFLPSCFVYKVDIEYMAFKKELFLKFKFLGIFFILTVVIVLIFSRFYTSFFREHKPLRYSINPVYWIYSTGKYVSNLINSADVVVKPIAEDVKINKIQNQVPKLVIVVVGEAARADRFSLNGYTKNTNPLLSKEDVYNFSNAFSCGTSTAYSVPCMFSVYNRDDYSQKKANSTENVLDILLRTNEVNILWRDNNSDSKGVAIRTNYEDYKTPKNNTICEGSECRDEGMLVGLDKFIDKNKNKDILIVLHQMGNHGPAYYKRYPKSFEVFKPVCLTNQFEKCTQEEINNAYDNAILYTDYFLSKVIKFLKSYSSTYDTAMLYASDHGESLGENGIYLHGLPYFMAPENQKHIGFMMWFGDSYLNKYIDKEKLISYTKNEVSHNNFFHTILGLFNVETKVYKPNLDILQNARK